MPDKQRPLPRIRPTSFRSRRGRRTRILAGAVWRGPHLETAQPPDAAGTNGEVGLWRGRRWGYWLAVVMMVINLGGNVVNVITGTEPRAVIGIPIVGAILAYLLRKRMRYHFNNSTL